jgi:putative ABC transport system permease protein
MSTAAPVHQALLGTGNGGVPARRAVVRWAWRLFRREWRQQLLVLVLVLVAVAATVIGATVATNDPPPANTGFGTARDMFSAAAPDPHLASQIATLRQRSGPVDVIENQTLPIPGSIETYDLRAQNPHGPFGQPMLSLTSGHYPATAGQVAVTSVLASAFRLKIGDLWRLDGTARRVTGIVANPQNLLDEFALVLPGQVTAPTQVIVLFDAHGRLPSSISRNVSTPNSVNSSNSINPETISLAAATLGMLLIALVGIGGFTVLAQRRLRSIGMLGAQGATDRHIRLVVRANGVVTGVVGAVAGFVLGLLLWLAYRPQLESSSHHTIGVFALPWLVVGLSMALAVLATYFAAARPARTIARVPIVAALSGRPAPPKQVRRWALPAGVVVLVLAFFLLGLAGAQAGTPQASGGNGDMLQLVVGLIAVAVAVVLLSPAFLAGLARMSRWTPIAVRLALRDLARYRARSGSALGAISLSLLIATIVIVVTAARFGNVLDYAGPNLTSSQLIVYAPGAQGGGPPPGALNPNQGPAPATKSQLTNAAASARQIASELGSHSVITLEQTSASLQHAAAGRNWSGPVYVGTPQLLAAFGIKSSQFSPDADILTMRPGLDTMSKMQLTYGNYNAPNGPGGRERGGSSYPCPASECLADPKIEEASALPSGTSAPNTVLTEHAVQALGLTASTQGWLIQTPHPLTSAQIYNARQGAATAGMSIETRNSIPSLTQVTNVATIFGILLALGILAMSVGLIRSETASDLRTLTATGADSRVRRTIAAVTAGALALAGAVTALICAYLTAIGFFRTNQLDGLSALGSVPVVNLLLILIGMPLVAMIGGWLLAGREPAGLARQPME